MHVARPVGIFVVILLTTFQNHVYKCVFLFISDDDIKGKWECPPRPSGVHQWAPGSSLGGGCGSPTPATPDTPRKNF